MPSATRSAGESPIRQGDFPLIPRMIASASRYFTNGIYGGETSKAQGSGVVADRFNPVLNRARRDADLYFVAHAAPEQFLAHR